MTDIAKETRAALAERFTLARPRSPRASRPRDGVIKWLIEFAPGVEAETVFIPDVAGSGALCVSSQVGCTLNCTFCHTGTQGLVRNLTAAEIVAQVQIARDDLGEWPAAPDGRRLTNIVFMGMGEPLYNLDNVADALDIISDNEGIAISRRRITVSTSGVVPQLKALGERTGRHAGHLPARHRATSCATSWCRSTGSYPIAELMAAVRAYPGLSNARRVTFEYVMLKGVNDTPADAKALVKLIAGIPAKINLIPFNPWPGAPYECSDWRDDRGLRRHPQPRRLRLADPHAARPRHPRRLRPAEVGEREGAGQRPAQGGGRRSGLIEPFLLDGGRAGWRRKRRRRRARWKAPAPQQLFPGAAATPPPRPSSIEEEGVAAQR